jgi:hypothetical protein
MNQHTDPHSLPKLNDNDFIQLKDLQLTVDPETVTDVQYCLNNLETIVITGRRSDGSEQIFKIRPKEFTWLIGQTSVVFLDIERINRFLNGSCTPCDADLALRTYTLILRTHVYVGDLLELEEMQSLKCCEVSA